ncbi:MAG: hypothetical protein PHR45_06120 [Muribaculaceae bacterium]|nr:hypothetical protein [Muribaculaceae bacterium]
MEKVYVTNEITTTNDPTHYIVTSNIVISRSITFADDSILEFQDDGKISCVDNISSGSITLSGNRLVLIAPQKEIFDVRLSFEGNWIMERSFPQWFGAKSSERDLVGIFDVKNNSNAAGNKYEQLMKHLSLIPDCSEAINKAIEIKGVGEVFISKWFYKISKYINVKTGILLAGEGCDFVGISQFGTILYPWKSDGLDETTTTSYLQATSSNWNLKNVTFPRSPEDTNQGVKTIKETYTVNYDSGYMIAVNVKEDFEYRDNYIFYEQDRAYPPYTTKITNLGIANIRDSQADTDFFFSIRSRL